MHYIKNYDSLATNPNRKVVLQLIEAAFAAIQPKEVFNKHFSLKGNILTIQEKTYNLNDFERVFLVGFGKGSAEMCRIIEETLGDKLHDGLDIDVIDAAPFRKVHYTKGTHPLPSQTNFDYTETVIKNLSELGEKDLVIIVTCGGGSVLFEKPHTFSLQEMITVNEGLLKSGATISEINVIRKHLSKVKAGGLAKIIYPATAVNLIFSDVPGNDLSVIASAPLVKNPTTIHDAIAILKKYKLSTPKPDDLVEPPKDEKYFKHVSNVLMLSNLTALDAMEKKAKTFGYQAFVKTDKLQGDAHIVGKQLLHETQKGELLLAGGETTVKVKGNGRGGRNQTVVLSALAHMPEDTVLASFGTDGWDFYGFAGALADQETLKKADKKNLAIKTFLDDDNSYEFWKKVGDGIDTGKMESNVSDLFIVFRPK